MKKIVLGMSALVVLAGAAYWYYFGQRDPNKVLPTNKGLTASDRSAGLPGDDDDNHPAYTDYRPSDSDTFEQAMGVVDLANCQDPEEIQMCQAFKLIVEKQDIQSGASLFQARFMGSGYDTLFVSKLDVPTMPNVDTSLSFLAVDTQDPPEGTVKVYIFAKRGRKLIQIEDHVDVPKDTFVDEDVSSDPINQKLQNACHFTLEELYRIPTNDHKTSDTQNKYACFYGQTLINEQILSAAKKKIQELEEIFALEK